MSYNEVNDFEWASEADYSACEFALQSEMAKHGLKLDRRDDPSKSDMTNLLDHRNEVRRTIKSICDRATESNREPTKQERAAIKGGGERISWIERQLKNLAALDAHAKAKGGGIVGIENWRDSGGRSVPVLEPRQSFSALGTGAPPLGYNFGEFIRAAVVGTNAPEIRNALSEGTDSAGGYSVPVELLREFIDKLRAKTVVIQAGARTVPLDTQKTNIARIASDPVPAWRNENAALAESDPTFEQVQFVARSLAVVVKVSRELLDDSLNLNEALTAAFTGALAVELDRVALMGSGTAPEPRGIFNTSGIGSVSMGTNGAAIANWAKLLDTAYELSVDNAGPPTAAIMHPRTLRAIDGLVDTQGQPLRRPGSMEGLPFLQTSGIPITQTQGTSSNASSIILGNFRDLLIGIRQDLRIEILRERYAENHQYAFVAHLRADVAVAHPESFAKLIGVIP